MNKRAQIGVTLTWFVAFMIIFFMMLIFFALSSSLFLKQRVAPSWLGGGFSEIAMERYEAGDLRNQNVLMSILNTPLEFEGKDMRVKDVLVLLFLDKGSVEDSLVLMGDLINCEEYVFEFPFGYVAVVDGEKSYGAGEFLGDYVDGFPVVVGVFYDGNKIDVEFSGKC